MNRKSNKSMQQTKSLAGFILGSSLICFILFIPSNAHADPITLTLYEELTGTIGPQSVSNPCIIAGTHCHNPDGFPYTDFKQGGSISAYGEWSPIYQISDFPFEELKFNVAIDVNTAKNGEFLEAFIVYLNPVFDSEGNLTNPDILYEYYGTETDGFIGNILHNDGNAWANWSLRSIDLTQYEGTNSEIVFWASWNNASGGAESFFLFNADSSETSSTVTTPEPTSLLLLGTGFGVLGCCIIRRRRKF